MLKTIDLRSDTVTQPTPEMRRAMASADVGDDVYGEDPTIRRLEERAAALLERPAGLFVPSGTMGNQIAVHLFAQPGSEVIGEARCHIFNFEMGAMAAISGALPRPVAGPRGLMEPDDVERVIQPRTGYTTPTALLALENTHNLAGGTVLPPQRLSSLVTVARNHGIPVHLDGARIFNASVALGISPALASAGCDTVMFCLSKGLSAPVGSVLVGDEDTIGEARRIRKMLGGGMRQAGILAAAGLVALEEMVDRLGEDHATARRLAEGIAVVDGIVIDPVSVETNIVVFAMGRDARMSAQTLKDKLAASGILVHALGGNSVRAVTHVHVSREDVDIAVSAIAKALSCG